MTFLEILSATENIQVQCLRKYSTSSKKLNTAIDNHARPTVKKVNK